MTDQPKAPPSIDFEAAFDLAPNIVIGPYRILHSLGRGGVGTVYKAVRDDEFRKTVAIKVLHFEARAEADLRRFRQERQILAELEHPNIARLIDGGTTAHGIPYIVLEYVEGQPINVYCTERRLSVAQRLNLVRTVCSALQYAHQKLIGHRDIKPANVLVTSDGIPKLLDFGIAKLLSPEAFVDCELKTITGMLRMTPDYASPEQVRGEPVSAATDVYAMGAVLFELLTGQRPHRLRNYDMAEILREVCENEVRRPSSVGGADLRGDLDTIVLTAMQKDPERRYNSMEQLSEDLRRYLGGFPVRAREDTWGYRAGKYLRRNWFALAALTLVVGSLTGGVLVARNQAARAEEEFQQARKLAHIALFDVSRGLGWLPGGRTLRDQVVRQSLEYLDRLTPRARRDPTITTCEFTALMHPKLRTEIAEGYYQIGQLQHSHDLSNTGNVKGALQSWERALDLIRQDTIGDRGSSDATKLMADLLLSIGEAEMSLGHTQKAREAFGQAEPLSKTEIVLRPEAEQSYGSLLSVYNLEGDNELLAGDPQRALERYQLSLREGEEGGRRSGEDRSSYQLSLGIRLGDVYRALGQIQPALDWYRRSLSYAQDQEAKTPGRYSAELYDAILHGLLGELSFGPALTLHNRQAALLEFRQGYELMDRLERADPDDVQVRDFFIMLAARYVYALRGTDPEAGLAVARRAARAAATIPQGTGIIDFEIDRTAASLTLARALAASYDPRAATAAFSDAVRIYREASIWAGNHPQLAALGILALLEQGDEERRPAHYEEAYRIAESYTQAHPAHAYLSALRDMARQRLAKAGAQALP